jgi:eukaryotic-like serine/threonine-protein kinase
VVYHHGVYEAGTVVAGKYRIEHPLGSGGMGVVVAAKHLQLGTPVALKFLHHDMMQNQGVVERFMREARSSAQLRGDNVCRVSDVGVTETGQPFIVMELLSGEDLGTVLKHSGALQLSTAAEVIMQACIALGEAHALGFVHRDIKPANLFWTNRADGSALIKVLDFGVAKAPEEMNFSLTQTQNVIGSPGYMSPEQLKSSKTVDARSDIWALGIVLYELVSGRKPFHGESITELALRVAMDPTPPLSGGVPASFEYVISRCLEKEPQRRFRDVAELAAALAPFVGPVRGQELAYGVTRVLRGGNQPIQVVATVQGAPNTPTTLRGANGVVTGSNVPPRRSWRLPAVMGLGAAVGVSIALGIVMGGRNQHAAGDRNAPVETKQMQVAPATQEVTPTSAQPTADPKSAAVKSESKPATTVKSDAKPAATVKSEAKPAATVKTEPKPAATVKTAPKPTPTVAAEPKPAATATKVDPKPAAKPTAVKTAKVESAKPKPIAPKPTKPKPKPKPKEDVGDSRL